MADTRGAVQIGQETVLMSGLGAWGEQENVLSCPGCDSWQLHYTNAVSMQWITQKWVLNGRTGMQEPVVDTSEWEDLVESILREHVGHECPHPRMILELLKQRDRKEKARGQHP